MFQKNNIFEMKLLERGEEQKHLQNLGEHLRYRILAKMVNG